MTRMTTWTRFSQYLLVVRLHEPTSDVGKCGSLRHSTTSFSENFVVAKTSYQMLEIYHLVNKRGLYVLQRIPPLGKV